MKLMIDGIPVVPNTDESLLQMVRRIGLDAQQLSGRPLAAKIAGEVFNLNYVPVRKQDINEDRLSIRRAMAASNGEIHLLRYDDPAGKDVYARTVQFMLFLAIVFILLGIRQFAPKINTIALSLAVGFVMLSALSLVNADRLIARYNVDRYIDNTLKTVDVSALRELGDPAIPELVRLEKYLIKNKTDEAAHELYYIVRDTLSGCEREREGERTNIFEFDIPTFSADRALQNREHLGG